MRKPTLPNCPKCGQMLESVNVKSSYIEAFDNDVDRNPVLINSGIFEVSFSCHGEVWSEWHLREWVDEFLTATRPK